MTLDRMKVSAQTVRDNIAILEQVKDPDDAGYYLQLEHEKFVLECIEKQIPKKPNFRKDDKKTFADCPNCNETLTYEDKIKANFYKFNYCFYCGQSLDWSDHPTEKGGANNDEK